MQSSSNADHVMRGSLVIGLLLFFGLFTFNVMTRTADFTDPDTMNFVNVAQNIKDGRGISQSALGFNMPRFNPKDPIPTPLTAQPPVYPILIAFLSCTGITCTTAGLMISVLCYFLTLLISYRICLQLFDENTALFAVACLLLYEPLRRISATTFSEALGLMLLCCTLLALLCVRGTSTRKSSLMSFLSGLLGGLTFSTRFALAPLVGAGGIFVLIESRRKFIDYILYIAGFMLPAGWVWARNYSLIGSIMPEPNPSNVGFITNANGFICLTV